MPEFERPVPVHEPRADSWGDVVESVSRRRWPRRRLVGGGALAAALGLLASADVGSAPASEAPRTARSPIPAPPVVTGPLRLELPPVTLRLPGTITLFDIEPSGYAALTATDCGVPGCVVRWDAGRSWSRSERLKPLHPRAVPGFGWSGWYGEKQPRPVVLPGLCALVRRTGGVRLPVD